MMARMTAREYYLEELRIAMDSSDPRHILPPIRGAGRILDVGCGAGQSLLARFPDRVTFGVDVNGGALAFGRQMASQTRFTAASGESLPFASGSFEAVISRVAMPYMNIPSALLEFARVLRRGGELWVTLHDIAAWRRNFQKSGWKGKIFQLYVLVNGIVFHLTGRQFRFINGRCESFQTERAMKRVLGRAGFQNIRIRRGRHFEISATRI